MIIRREATRDAIWRTVGVLSALETMMNKVRINWNEDSHLPSRAVIEFATFSHSGPAFTKVTNFTRTRTNGKEAQAKGSIKGIRAQPLFVFFLRRGQDPTLSW